MTSFENRTAMITGAAGGIGAALARILAERGANLVLVDIDAAALEGVRAELAETVDVLAVVADVAEEAEVARVFDEAEARFGHVDGLASNAAILGAMGPLVDTELETLQRLLRVNAQSGFLFVRAFARAAQRSGRGGSVVVTSSTAGLRGYPGLTAYSMTKQALIGLTRSAAVELAELDVRVNAVVPGRVDTGLIGVLGSRGGSQVGLTDRPISRLADPREIAYLMAWLLSDESSFATGGVFPVDGGHTA